MVQYNYGSDAGRSKQRSVVAERTTRQAHIRNSHWQPYTTITAQALPQTFPCLTLRTTIQVTIHSSRSKGSTEIKS